MIRAVLAVLGVVLLVSGGTVMAAAAFSFTSTPPAYGQLKVLTAPVPGEIFIDGSHAGFGHALENVTSGTHSLSFGPIAGYVAPKPLSEGVKAGYVTEVNVTYAYCGSGCPVNQTSTTTTTTTSTSQASSTSTSATVATTIEPVITNLTGYGGHHQFTVQSSLPFLGGVIHALGPVGTLIVGAVIAVFGLFAIVAAAVLPPEQPGSARGARRA